MSLCNNDANQNEMNYRLKLKEEWISTFGSNPPRGIGIALMRQIVEQAIQELKVPSAIRTIERQLASDTLALSPSERVSAGLRVGDRIVRGWGGVNHEVTILQKGFSYRGGMHRSLSEIARLITGVRWSGPRFFGIREKNL